MIPTEKEFVKLSKKYNYIPVAVNLLADTLTPVSVLSLLEKEKNCFMLESVSGGERISRYSFIGYGKSKLFICHGENIEIRDGNQIKKYKSKDPLAELDNYTQQWKYPNFENLPVFQGGGVGYIGYDVFRTVENLPNCPKDDLQVPDILFGFHEVLLAFDHASRCLSIIVHADLKGCNARVAYKKANEHIKEVIALLKKAKPLSLVENVNIKDPLKLKFTSNIPKKKYMDGVLALKEHIKAGNIFQGVLSQRLEAPTKAKPINIYRALRAVNPSPYMFYLKFDKLFLLGSSPEILVSVDETRKITLKPIAGTRPRGKNKLEDLKYEESLLADPKEIAEHTMLVDLARNDLGRVSDYNSVKIEDRMIVEHYSHVMHIVSTVSGNLSKKYNALDAFKACYPAGTLTGAPKIRAMQILDELETTKRGPFGGGVGYIDHRGHMDTCITIRTIVLKGGKAYVQAGAGIVADSVPESEYLETLNKAKGLLKAIEIADRCF